MPKKISVFSFLFVFLLLVSGLWSLVSPTFAAPGDPPNSQPCKNAVLDNNKLTDNYITQPNGNPYKSFTVTGSGIPGTDVQPADLLKTITPANFSFTVDFSQLQAIFGTQNSNYLEGNYQSQTHQDANIMTTRPVDFNTYHGPGQKSAPIVLTDQLRVSYVKYLYNKPQLSESANKYADINGLNPKTIYEMIKTPFPYPPVPPSLGGDKFIWGTTWGMYWEKIPTAYSEFYLGKLEFRAIAGLANINQVQTAKDKNGNFSPICPIPLRTIEFVMPDFFRTTATSGELNQVIVPNAAQSKDSNNLILGLANDTKNALSSFIQKCVYLATQNPLSKKLHKIVSEVIKTVNPIKTAYAQTPSCTLNTSSTIAGGNVIVTSINGLSGTIGMQGAFGSPVYSALGNLPSGGQATITVPNGAQPGLYVVRVGGFGVGCTPNLQVDAPPPPPPPPPACTLNIGSVSAGSNVIVTSINGLTGTIGMQGAFGTPVYSALGNLPANGQATITVPTNAQPGLYVVRVGGFGVGCTPNLQVNAVTLPPSCSYTGPNPAISGNQITVTYQGTIAGDSVVLASRLSGAIGQTFGQTQDSLSASKTATYTLSASAGGYTVLIQTPGPIIANVANCGNIDINALTPACVFSPTTIIAGQNLGIITNNFPAGPLTVKIAGTVFGNVITVGTIPITGGSVTIPASAPAPQVYQVLVNPGVGADTVCTGTLQVNPAALPPACVFSPTTITAGGTVGIITNNFTLNPIPVNLVGTVFGNVIPLNSIPQTGGAVTIPTGTAGVYEVRLGNSGATTTCNGTLTVNAASIPAICSFTGPNPAVTGNQITVTYQGTISGDSVVLASRLSGAIAQVFGPTQDTTGSPATAIYTLTAGPGGYAVLIQTPGPIVANAANCGNIDINAPIASCLVNPTNVTAGGTFNVGGLGFDPAGTHSVSITGFYGTPTFNNLAIMSFNSATGAWTATNIIVPATAPGGLYVVRVDSTVCAPNLSVTAAPPGPVTFDPLSPNSCVKNPKSSKNSTAPYCALPLTNTSGQPQLLSGETCTDKTDANKLDAANTNVVCTFIITWNTTQPFYIPKDGEDLGPWNQCTGNNTFKTCTSTIAVWPDFRIPLLAETWNNTLYSVDEPGVGGGQITGRPGVYSYFTPKSISGDNVDVNFTSAQVALDIRNCITTVLPRTPDKNNPYCQDLLQIIASLSKIKTIQGCDGLTTILDTPPTPAQIDTLRNCASAAFVALNKTLPGDVNNPSTSTDVKQRFIGATDCFKQFVRDVALKPLALQKALNIEQSCKTTSLP